MNKKELLLHLETLMFEAIAKDQLEYYIGCEQEVVEFYGAKLTLNKTYDCLDRTYRRVKRPDQYAKLKKDGALLKAAKRFCE